MKLGTNLPTGQIAKRLPGGTRRKQRFGRLPIGRSKSRIPGGRAVGTAGGLLLGAGAAVAAAGAAQRMGNRAKKDEAESATDTTSETTSASEEQTGDEQNTGRKGIFGRVKETVGGKGDKGESEGKSGGKGGGAKKVKVTNIEEHIDIGAPRRLVYNQWTQFQDYPSFMKKVVSVDQAEDGKLNWKAKIFWSSRKWESTIVEQVPDRHIVWRSTGAKGHVDGTVSFHKIAPNLTRVLLVLEYHPQGFMERTGNLWRAQGRRVRLELKHFRRYVMTQSLLRPDEIEGWRGEIHDSEVVKTHEEAIAEEEKAESEQSPEYQEA
jgi:uncharacterized membrane protein